ncbi:MAG: hypothetical protein IJE48_00290 [Clostridia bacterium]|nr:hypothetical protein [Clostridia bacterium]
MSIHRQIPYEYEEQGYKTREEQIDELVADQMFEVFANERAVKEFVAKDRTLAQKVFDHIKSLINDIKAIYKKLISTGQYEDMAAWQEDLDALQKVNDMMLDALNNIEQKSKAEKNTSDEVHNSTKRGEDITRADIDSLREIGRKSINEFTSEDLQIAEKWAKKFYRELGAKSPFFRAWFGDWRENDQTSITVASIPKYIAGNAERVKQRGTVVCKDTTQGDSDGWTINISRQGETNTISHAGKGRLSELGLSNIRGLIENAVLLDTEVHEHHANNSKSPETDRIAFDHKLYALGEDVNGIVGLYKITVEEIFQDPKHPDYKRFHNLKYIEKVAENIGSLTDENKARHAESTNDVSTTKYSVADLFAFVKKYDAEFQPKPASKIVNADGTPKVMYHGTKTENGEFYVFDYSKAKKRGGLGFKSLGKGNYFTSQQLNGTELYGERIIKSYLDIKNPYEFYGTNFKTEVCNALGLSESISYDDLQSEMRTQGYDGVILYGKQGVIGIAVAFDSNQIKSADPVTYDDKGKVIPLSQRFDTSEDDIRFATKRYWKPNMPKADLEHIRLVAKNELYKTDNYLDNITKWLYNSKNGKTYFALYSTENESEPTILYASIDDLAAREHNFILDYVIELERESDDRRSKTFNEIFNRLKNSNNLRTVHSVVYGNGRNDNGDVSVHSGQSRGGIGEPFDMIPYFKDLISLIQGYDSNRMDTQVLANIADVSKTLLNSNKTPWEKIKSVLNATGMVTGLPFKNVVRDVEMIVNGARKIISGDYEPTTLKGIEYAIKGAYDSTNYKLLDVPNLAEQVIEAHLNGDKAHYDKQWNNMLEKYGGDEKTANAQIKTALGKMYKEDKISKSDAEKILVDMFEMKPNDIHFKLEEWKTGEDKYDDWYEAVRSGKNIASVAREYKKYGIDKSALSSCITSEFKEEYLSLRKTDPTQASVLRTKLLNAYVALGYDRKEKSEDIDEWVKQEKKKK